MLGGPLSLGDRRRSERVHDVPEQNKSIGWVAGMLALAVAYFGWGFLGFYDCW